MLELNAGGWKINPAVGKMPEKSATAFQQVVGSLIGVKYTPLIHCGEQVVNGTNHMIISLGEMSTNPPTKFLAKIILNESPDGKFSLVSIEPITANAFDCCRGGWDLNPTENVPEHAKNAFEAAVHGLCGANYEILMYCGSQVVAGMNYLFICKGTSVTKEPVDFIAKVIINVAMNVTLTIEKIV